MKYSNELTLLRSIAEEVGAYQLEKQKHIGDITRKDDRSPVTEVDRNSEDIITTTILEHYPADGIYGEERGERKGTSGRRWIIDPIDGTRPYIKGIPTFSILIGLEDQDEIVAGVVFLPALQECYYAAKGAGAFCNSTPINVSDTSRADEAMGAFLGLTERIDAADGAALLKLMQGIDYPYGFMDAYSYMAVAAGRLDCAGALIDFPWDRAPAAIIIKEAGGRVSDLQGRDTIYGGGFLVSNGKIHTELCSYFK
ncbi:MAG: inositol monophosphatase family protein [Fibrobacterota bacterium]